MSRKCSVKGCPGQRNKRNSTETNTFFSFPLRNEGLLKKWLDKVELQSELSSVSKICNLHFENNCFVKIDNSIKLLPSSVPLEYKEKGEKILNMKSSSQNDIEQHDIKPNVWNIPLDSSDKISQFEDFINGLSSPGEHETWKENWKVFKQPDGVCFYRLSRDWNFSNVTISYKILINKQLKVLIYSNDDEADVMELNWILKSSTLELWSQFYNMLDYYQVEPHIQQKSNASHHMRHALKSLNKITSSRENDELVDPIKQRLTFALSKVELVKQNQSFEDSSDADIDLKQAIKLEKEDDEEEFIDVNVDPDFVMQEEDFEPADDDNDEDEIVPVSKRRRSTTKLVETRKKHEKKERKSRTPKTKVVGEILQCKHCERLGTKEQLRNHFNRAHNGPVYCDKCGKKLKSRMSLSTHMIRHQENNRVKCPHCDDMLLPESLRRHIKVRHEGYKPFACSICGKLFSSRTLVKEHEKIHGKGEIISVMKDGEESKSQCFQCPTCLQRYERGGKIFREHIAKCQGIPIEKKRNYLYPCPECGKKCGSKVTCAEHMALKHNKHIENIDKFCFECKAEFDDPMHSRIHGCDFQCPLCGYRFSSQQKLDKHVEDKHETGEERPFACDLCHLSFKTSNHLRSHKTTIHMSAEDKKFVCEICNRRYGFQFQLSTHIKQSHSDVKRFGCSYCGMKFKKMYTMKQHYKFAHGEEFTYLCPECPEKMKTLNELKRHRQDLHGVSLNVQKYHEG